ncbi:MAG: Gfo/Idh/MocA family oxidoreductase [Lentisphaerae bacterium]|jgi:UDP-N-acetyl-2-amino-2-deoxyglucuronate dehydrogenase|nr:Gfo/Idh/MocA family oxidoreductase [Lentisphaerota bacterium]MBT5604329.1 Gfo/Idh/MocA family oxidoreductase [Lentisphaerota bacterium]MBT7060260.1 Gfo/Idh/MocA family oxidoreductase [Lentisphaerota bacterium]MBT7847573.1 Gfo/Idh/MocA family oxidoreductase [Lentisphaerota bacterium]
MAHHELRFGVVGLGMGKHHCKAATEAEGCRLVAVCDIDEDRLVPAAKEHNVTAYRSYAEMLRDPEVDAVSVATPSGMHADMAMEAVAAGKHLLVEKPVDIDVAKVRALVQAIQASGVKAAGVFQSRTDPLNRRIKAAIEEGRLGQIIGVHALLPWLRKDSYFQGAHGSWKGTWGMDGGGSLMNQGVHTVDLIQWLAGRVESVFGAFGIYAHDIEAEDKTAAFLRFRNGALGTLSTTTCAIGGLSQSILIHGDKGTIQKSAHLTAWKMADDEDGQEEARLMQYYGAPEKRPEGETVATDPMAVGAKGHTFEMEDLAIAVREGRDPYITIESAMHAVEIVNAVYESGRERREVIID